MGDISAGGFKLKKVAAEEKAAPKASDDALAKTDASQSAGAAPAPKPAPPPPKPPPPPIGGTPPPSDAPSAGGLLGDISAGGFKLKKVEAEEKAAPKAPDGVLAKADEVCIC